ncbi:hypothetical protein D3C81_1812710 [compost metagenome]
MGINLVVLDLMLERKRPEGSEDHHEISFPSCCTGTNSVGILLPVLVRIIKGKLRYHIFIFLKGSRLLEA